MTGGETHLAFRGVDPPVQQWHDWGTGTSKLGVVCRQHCALPDLPLVATHVSAHTLTVTADTSVSRGSWTNWPIGCFFNNNGKGVYFHTNGIKGPSTVGPSKPSSLVRFLPVSQYLLELASGVRVLECGVLTSREA